MRAAIFLLIGIVLASGCLQSLSEGTVSSVAKNLPAAKDFLQQYPEAELKTSVYTPTAVQTVLSKFAEDCPSLGEAGKSYYKITITDKTTKTQLMMWMDASDNSLICAIRAAATGEPSATTQPPATTTPPTTAQTTTTAQATTTTLAATTTTSQPLADLTIGTILVEKTTGLNNVKVTAEIKNPGQLNAGGNQVFRMVKNSTQHVLASWSFGVNSVPSTSKVFVTDNYLLPAGTYTYTVIADYYNIVPESNETNNQAVKTFTVPLP